MVHAEHGVILALDGLVKDDVRRDGADGLDSLTPSSLDRRRNFRRFFVAHQAAVAAVRIQGRDTDPRDFESIGHEAIVG